MSVNKVILIGNVGAEPEVKYIERGLAVAAVNLATSEPGYTLENGTQVPERTEWHRVILWRRLAEIVEKYVHKGDKLYIEGKLRNRSYDDNKGIRRYITEVEATSMELLTPKSVSQARTPQATAPAAPTTQPASQPSGQGAAWPGQTEKPTEAPF